MQTIQTHAVIGLDHTLTVALPADAPPGPCRVVVVIGGDDIPYHKATGQPLIFSKYPVHPPSETTYRREEMYGDDGR